MASLLNVVALAVAVLAFVPARAAEPAPKAGVIFSRSTYCAMVKVSGNGEQCRVPTLPSADSSADIAASRMRRANFYIDLNDKKAALAEAEAALILDAANVDARHLVARLALSTGDFGRAEREINLAIEQRPDDPDLRATNAVRIKIMGNLQGALKEFDAILERHAGYRFAREERAGLLLQLGSAEKAIADIDVLLAERPDTNLFALRAAAHLARSEIEASIADYGSALKLAPRRFDLLTGRAAAYELKGDDQAALADLDAILGPLEGPPSTAMREGDLARYRIARAKILVRQRRFSDAAADMMTSISGRGRRSLLRAQIYLRHNGFPETPLDGEDTQVMRAALQACFGLNSCFQKISESL